MYRAFWVVAILAAVAVRPGLAPGFAAADMAKIAAFDFELIDTSLEGEVGGERADEQVRLGLITRDLRERLRDSGRYQVIDIEPARARITDAGYLHGCVRCASSIAADLGADLALTGTVQKVSNLILNINLYLYDAASGDLLRAMSVDIRGNTDESWLRGVSYLARNRLLEDDK